MGTRDWDLQQLSNAAGAVRHEVDVLVIGGGPAGAWAAISAAYYAFHAETSGFPVEGLKLIEEVKRFLRAENLIRRDFSVAQWTVAGAD